MIRFRRRHRLDGVGERGVGSVGWPGVRFYTAWMRGGFSFDTGRLRVDPTALGSGECNLSIQLEGRLLVRALRRPLEPGTIAVVTSVPWDEVWLDEFRVLVVELRDPPGAAHPPRPVTPVVFEHAQRLADLLEGEGASQHVSRCLDDLIAALRDMGFVVPDARGASDPEAQRTAEILGDVLSNLQLGPQVSDFARRLGVSPRHVPRRLAALRGLVPGCTPPYGWRRYLHTLRVSLASTFLSRPDVTVESVARALGYGSARALILALSHGGLPPPRALRTSADAGGAVSLPHPVLPRGRPDPRRP